MPLVTTPAWNLEHAKLVRRPLYLLVIEDLVEALSTFRAEDMEVLALTGYGIGGYGIHGYGY
jgi:hypothetical protein